MDELDQLRAHYLSLVRELRQMWWQYHLQGEGNSDMAKVIWSLRSTLQTQARSIQLAQEGRGLAWLQEECSTHIRGALQELDSDWADGKPMWWLWFNQKEAALYRLTRQIATKVRLNPLEKTIIEAEAKSHLCAKVD